MLHPPYRMTNPNNRRWFVTARRKRMHSYRPSSGAGRRGLVIGCVVLVSSAIGSTRGVGVLPDQTHQFPFGSAVLGGGSQGAAGGTFLRRTRCVQWSMSWLAEESDPQPVGGDPADRVGGWMYRATTSRRLGGMWPAAHLVTSGPLHTTDASALARPRGWIMPLIGWFVVACAFLATSLPSIGLSLPGALLASPICMADNTENPGQFSSSRGSYLKVLVPPAGIEPATIRLEGGCSLR